MKFIPYTNKDSFSSSFDAELEENARDLSPLCFEHAPFNIFLQEIVPSLYNLRLNEDKFKEYVERLQSNYTIFTKCKRDLKETLYLFQNLSKSFNFYQDIDGYKAETIIMISFLALISGAKNIEQISEYAYFNNPFLQVFLPNMPKPHYELSAYAIYTLLQSINLDYVLSTFSLLFSNNYSEIKMDISLNDTIENILIGNNTKFKDSIFYDDIDKNLRMLPRFFEYREIRDNILEFCHKRRVKNNLEKLSDKKLMLYYYKNPHNALINIVLYFKELII